MPVIPVGSTELRVLVVDDDIELCQLLSEYLGTEGYAVEAVHTGRGGVERALEGMARVDSGVDLERPTRFDLGSVVEEVSTDAEYEARTRECAVQFNQRRECVVEGAREMLRGAVENVVRNAVRHTGDRTRVEVSLDRHPAANGSRAIITVRDHGPGVPEETVDTLFVPFNRVLTDGRSNPERTGLGLAITRRTFEVHGGSATATNAPGGGFFVTLEMPVLEQSA